MEITVFSTKRHFLKPQRKIKLSIFFLIFSGSDFFSDWVPNDENLPQPTQFRPPTDFCGSTDNRLGIPLTQLAHPNQDWVLGPSLRRFFSLFSVSMRLFMFFCFPPGISLSAKGCPRPKCPKNPVFCDFPPVGVQLAKTYSVKKLCTFGEKLLGRADFPEKCP